MRRTGINSEPGTIKISSSHGAYHVNTLDLSSAAKALDFSGCRLGAAETWASYDLLHFGVPSSFTVRTRSGFKLTAADRRSCRCLRGTQPTAAAATANDASNTTRRVPVSDVVSRRSVASNVGVVHARQRYTPAAVAVITAFFYRRRRRRAASAGFLPCWLWWYDAYISGVVEVAQLIWTAMLGGIVTWPSCRAALVPLVWMAIIRDIYGK